jgi:hypothetical protein
MPVASPLRERVSEIDHEMKRANAIRRGIFLGSTSKFDRTVARFPASGEGH